MRFIRALMRETFSGVWNKLLSFKLRYIFEYKDKLLVSLFSLEIRPSLFEFLHVWCYILFHDIIIVSMFHCMFSDIRY